MMNNPPPPPAKAQPRCESGVVVPVIDVIGAVATVVVGSAAFIAVSAEDGPTTTRLGIAGASLGLGTTFVMSSVIGVRRAKRCERAVEAWQAAARSARLWTDAVPQIPRWRTAAVERFASQAHGIGSWFEGAALDDIWELTGTT
jgi:hypothetical protein